MVIRNVFNFLLTHKRTLFVAVVCILAITWLVSGPKLVITETDQSGYSVRVGFNGKSSAVGGSQYIGFVPTGDQSIYLSKSGYYDIVHQVKIGLLPIYTLEKTNFEPKSLLNDMIKAEGLEVDYRVALCPGQFAIGCMAMPSYSKSFFDSQMKKLHSDYRYDKNFPLVVPYDPAIVEAYVVKQEGLTVILNGSHDPDNRPIFYIMSDDGVSIDQINQAITDALGGIKVNYYTYYGNDKLRNQSTLPNYSYFTPYLISEQSGAEDEY